MHHSTNKKLVFVSFSFHQIKIKILIIYFSSDACAIWISVKKVAIAHVLIVGSYAADANSSYATATSDLGIFQVLA